MTSSKIQIDALISLAPSKVWELWTGPEHITKWNFAIPEWSCPSAKNDLRVGGKYVARMEARDGSFGFDFEATYDEVVPHTRLTYTLGDGRMVTTTFAELEGQTKVTTVFDAEKLNPEEMQRDGWQAILNNFKSYAEGAA